MRHLTKQRWTSMQLKNMSSYMKKQIELGYKKLEDCYITINSNGKQKKYIGGYVE